MSRLAGTKVQIENDANLAALSEAMLVKKDYHKVLYVTVSTGIGAGVIVDQKISRDLRGIEAGNMFLSFEGSLQRWETFASGKAIFTKYGQYAREINDRQTWREIVANLGLGLLPLEAIVQPDVIIIGGGIGEHFTKYGHFLNEYLQNYSSPDVPARRVVQAQHPEYAVIFGCFDLCRTNN